MNKLVIPTIKTFLLGVAILGLLLFLPAWRLNYWQGWLFIVAFMTSVSVIGVYLSLKDPELLERRKRVGPSAEQSRQQKIIMSLSILTLPALLIFCALDDRFGWSPVPGWVSILGAVMVVLGLMIDLVVFRANSFGGSTVQTFEDQKVISTGLYALVRHPMYAGVLVMIAGIPLALGSWLGLISLVVVLPALIWRILDEEKLLKKELPGYEEYAQKVHYRLAPYLW